MTTRPTEKILAEGRGFHRLRAHDALEAIADGALVVDIRPAARRRITGEIPGALVVAGPLREWRLGPGSPVRICELHERRVVVCCETGQSSVLAASALYGMGLAGVTDIAGGFDAWVAADLPVTPGGTLAGRFVPGSLLVEPATAMTA